MNWNDHEDGQSEEEMQKWLHDLKREADSKRAKEGKETSKRKR